jgi:hypothetical protein
MAGQTILFLVYHRHIMQDTLSPLDGEYPSKRGMYATYSNHILNAIL